MFFKLVLVQYILMGGEFMTKGFSLVELSVVLVIIGLLVAGVSVGSSLRDQAALRSVVADMKKYQMSYQSFKDIYKAPPGDFNQAAALWGTDCADTVSCNGGGDLVVNSIFFSVNSETQRAWKHLELAELIDDPIAIVPSSWNGKLNVGDVPQSKITGAGYFIAGGPIALDPYDQNSPFITVSAVTNAIFLGKESSFSALTVGALTGLQAYNLDVKFDDGKPDAAGNPTGATSGYIRAFNGQNSPANCSTAAVYNVIATTDSCVLGYQVDRE